MECLKVSLILLLPNFKLTNACTVISAVAAPPVECQGWQLLYDSADKRGWSWLQLCISYGARSFCFLLKLLLHAGLNLLGVDIAVCCQLQELVVCLWLLYASQELLPA